MYIEGYINVYEPREGFIVEQAVFNAFLFYVFICAYSSVPRSVFSTSSVPLSNRRSSTHYNNPLSFFFSQIIKKRFFTDFYCFWVEPEVDETIAAALISLPVLFDLNRKLCTEEAPRQKSRAESPRQRGSFPWHIGEGDYTAMLTECQESLTTCVTERKILL